MPDIVPLPPELCVPEDAPALADVLSGDAVEPGTDVPRRWVPSDDGAAEWAMRHVARLMNEREDLERQAAAWRAQIDDWYERSTRTIDRGVAFFDGALRTYALARRAINDDNKTLHLPSGEVRTRRASKPLLDITNEEALIQYLRHRAAGLITTTYRVMLNDLKPAVQVHNERAVWHVKMDCGDEFDTMEPDARFCRVCGAQAVVIDEEQVAHEQWWCTLIGRDERLPGVEVRDVTTTAEVVVR